MQNRINWQRKKYCCHQPGKKYYEKGTSPLPPVKWYPVTIEIKKQKYPLTREVFGFEQTYMYEIFVTGPLCTSECAGDCNLSANQTCSICLLYRVIQILRAASDGCRSRPWLACWPASGPLYSRCFQTLTLLFQFIFRVDGHAHRRTFAKRRR